MRLCVTQATEGDPPTVLVTLGSSCVGKRVKTLSWELDPRNRPLPRVEGASHRPFLEHAWTWLLPFTEYSFLWTESNAAAWGRPGGRAPALQE